MRKFIGLALFASFFSLSSFADNQNISPDEATSPACEAIAKACLDAGYSKAEKQGKLFWHDCMKPILFQQPVSGVTVDAKIVNACRQLKIRNLQEQLDQLKNINTKE